jgi:hypothetical protein
VLIDAVADLEAGARLYGYGNAVAVQSGYAAVYTLDRAPDK